MTHPIALRSGFQSNDASTIAYSDQYADEIEGADSPYENIISQTEDITKPQQETDLSTNGDD